MLNRTLSLLSVLVLGAVPLVANDIEPSKEKYTAPAAPAPIKVDGDLSEWAGVAVIADPMFAIPKGSGANGKYVLFEEYQGGTWTGPDDHTSAVQVVYDVDNVYFGFVVTDEYHENAANSAWNGDSVQLMIASADRTAQVALYNYALGGVEGALGEVIVMHEAGPGGDPACNCETTAVVRRDAAAKKTYYEIKLPAGALGLTKLDPGTKFGLGMAINDGDEATPGQKGWGGLGAHSIVFGKTPSETAEVTLGANKTTIDILGTGTESLLGKDLTDPEDDGDETAGAASPTWNWKSISASIEPAFEGGENAFNIFDNKLGPGNDKWCCDDPSPTNPHWVSVEFPNPVSLTHFTVSSANDVPDRDPIKWQIQGSNDGQNYSPIFVQDAPAALWTDRLQVIKFTLPAPSAPFRHIRYFVTDTPGTLHQIGEIEYFGTFGDSQIGFVSAINPQIASFSFRLNDAGNSKVDATTVKLKIDGQDVTIPTPTKVGSAIDVVYTPASPFAPDVEHTYSITSKDALGNTVGSDGTFKLQYGLLKASAKVTADTTKPGFIWRVFQNGSNQDNSNARTERALAGELGLPNQADPNAVGAALAPGKTLTGPAALIEFEVDGVINFSQTADEANGNFTPDLQMPGIPGLEGSTDGIAGEITTYIELPKGVVTMGVNSDDGFLAQAGSVNDALSRIRLGEFNGGRGAADTTYTFYVEEAGIYPFRTTWEEGGGGANVEWFSVKADGTKVLVNDSANGGFKAYRAAATPADPYVRTASPTPGATGIPADVDVTAEIVDTTATVDTASVTLKLDGKAVTPTVTKTAGVTKVVLASASLLDANSVHNLELTWKAGTATATRNWSFTVADYKTLSLDIVTDVGTGKDAGFRIRTVQSEAGRGNTDAEAEKQLLDNSGTPNVADLTGADANGFRNFTGVINFNQDAPGAVGNFNADNGAEDQPVPGIPGTGGSTDNFSQEVLTYLEFPAAAYVNMGVNSDDGFKVTPATGADATAPVLGIFNGGRGASDTLFGFKVPAAGVYPFRLIWYEGGGGANAEWFSVDKSGKKILINSTTAGAIKAYQTRTATPSARPTLSLARTATGITLTFSGGRLQSADAITGPFTDVAGATSPANIATTAVAKFYRVAK